MSIFREMEHPAVIYVLCNPAAGGGRALEALNRLEAHMKQRCLEYETGLTERHGHARELMRAAVEKGYRTIFTLGGDGTVFEAVNGLAESGRIGEVAVGLLPGGTGNDAAKGLGTPADPLEAFDALLDGDIREIDLWSANGAVFANVFGLGLDTDLSGWAEKTKKVFRGMPAYIAALFLTLFGFKFKRIKLVIDGKEIEREAVVLTASNGRYYGGGILVAPDASPDDGRLDVVLINRVWKPRIPGLLMKYIAGRHIREIKECEFFHAEELTISSGMAIRFETDGEVEQSLPVTIRRAESRLRTLVPRTAGHTGG